MTKTIKLPVGYATTGQGAGPMLVTERAGLFLEHGLDVTGRIIGSAKAVVAGLMSGEIVFGNLAAQSSKDKIESLRARLCDALVISPPEAIEAQQQGCTFLVDFGDYGLNFALGGIATRRATIRENPHIVESFVKAYVADMRRYKTDRAFTIGVQQIYSQLANPEVAAATYDLTAPGMPSIPIPKIAAFEVALKLLSREVPQAATANPAQFIDDRFIMKASQIAR